MDVGHDILNAFQFFSVMGDMKVGSGVFGELPEGSQPTPPPPKLCMLTLALLFHYPLLDFG